MLKNILKLEGSLIIEKSAQKKVTGGGPVLGPTCALGDPICCGTAQWQCGVGPSSGGHHEGYYQGNPLCFCY
ncbi:hypothetical protein [Aquimarina celericrescens]|uniref:Bacteriocin n=1 Tax=Aquimarina celericrescens TaxID=1964542 RepID=A0ABW5AX88_9FLAO|nr:hypothetical protein [Aquimarina celericrescens]